MADSFDKELFGSRLRRARIKAGYETAEEFAQALSSELGYAVSRQTLYNIESGKQEPKVGLYFAMVRLLEPDQPLRDESLAAAALPHDWKLSINQVRDLTSSVKSVQLPEEVVQRSSELVKTISETLNESLAKNLQPVFETIVSELDFPAITKALDAQVSKIPLKPFVSEDFTRIALGQSVIGQLYPNLVDAALMGSDKANARTDEPETADEDPEDERVSALKISKKATRPFDPERLPKVEPSEPSEKTIDILRSER